MTTNERITLDPAILAGKPVVRGTRLSVEFIIGLMADGWAEADILTNYPGLTHEDISAMLGLCARSPAIRASVPKRSVTMKFLAHENIPGVAVAALAAGGHDVVWVRSSAPGMTDSDVLAWAIREGRILLTLTRTLGNWPAMRLSRHRAASSCSEWRHRVRTKPAPNSQN
jgi:uncharacterized protein (DUF433 family)